MSVRLLGRLREGSSLLRALQLDPEEALSLPGDSRQSLQVGQGRRPDPILSSPKRGCRPQPCSAPSSTPPASTGRSSARCATSAPTTTPTSSATGIPAPCFPAPPSRDDPADGPPTPPGADRRCHLQAQHLLALLLTDTWGCRWATRLWAPSSSHSSAGR